LKVCRKGDGRRSELGRGEESSRRKRGTNQDVDVVVLVLLDDSTGVLVGVERVHEDEGDVALV